jgi:hypothetical protein
VRPLHVVRPVVGVATVILFAIIIIFGTAAHFKVTASVDRNESVSSNIFIPKYVSVTDIPKDVKVPVFATLHQFAVICVGPSEWHNLEFPRFFVRLQYKSANYRLLRSSSSVICRHWKYLDVFKDEMHFLNDCWRPAVIMDFVSDIESPRQLDRPAFRREALSDYVKPRRQIGNEEVRSFKIIKTSLRNIDVPSANFGKSNGGASLASGSQCCQSCNSYRPFQMAGMFLGCPPQQHGSNPKRESKNCDKNRGDSSPPFGTYLGKQKNALDNNPLFGGTFIIGGVIFFVLMGFGIFKIITGGEKERCLIDESQEHDEGSENKRDSRRPRRQPGIGSFGETRSWEPAVRCISEIPTGALPSSQD